MIDPEYWSDEEIGKWSAHARLFYIGLWNFADDEGRFKAHDDLLKAQIFPYDKKVNISKLKTEICRKVVWYEVDELQYGFLRNFLKHQRIDKPQPSKLPAPPDGFEEHSKNIPRTVPPNLKEVKRKEEKEKYLDFVFLSKKEYESLVSKIGQPETDRLIDELNTGIGSKGYKYASHYFTILSWFRRKKKEISSKTKLFPLPGRVCNYKSGCGMPAVYKYSGLNADVYCCADHLPQKVKEKYE